MGSELGLAGALAVLALSQVVRWNHEVPRGRELFLLAAVMFATLGATAGGLFALLVIALNRVRKLRRVSPWKVALLGAVPAALSSLQAFDQPMIVLALGGIGGLLAAVSFRMAQRNLDASVPDPDPAA